MVPLLIILLATLENVWPLIAGQIKTPPGYVFLGTIHHPADYFYYLSQFAQGSYRWITSINLYTSESVAPSFVGWSNVLTGRLFDLVGLSPFVAYQTSVLIFTVLLFVVAYAFTRSTLALYLFALFHAFPILREGKPSYGDYWNNFAVPIVRFGGVPHQLLLTIASMLMVYFAMQWKKKKQWQLLIYLGASSCVLASLQPVLWGLITISLLLTMRWPFVISLATGALPIMYLSNLFKTLPFSQLKLWEAGAQNALTPEHFLTATGPIFLIALFTMPLFVRHITVSKLFTLLFTLASLVLFLSPLPRSIGVSHVRFMSTLTIFFLSVIAANGLKTIRFRSVILVSLTLLLIPSHYITMRQAGQFDANNVYHYLPKSEYRFLTESGRLGMPNDIYLIAWPYNEVFPALTGKHSYHGHPLITISSTEKNTLATAAFNGTMPAETVKRFVSENRITFVISSTDNAWIASLPFLTRITASKTLVLYKVL